MHLPQGDERSDAELISAVRSADPSAFGVLFSRHAGPATAMARYYANDNFSADDLVSDAFEKVYSTLRNGGGPDVSFRAYLYTTVRRLAYEVTEKSRRTQVTDDFTAFEMPDEVIDPAVDTFENRMVTSAFAGLPERWQAVLWYLEVEGMRPPEVAVLLGLTANGVSALAYRAREGLREAYLQAHVSSDGRDAECELLRGKLGAYVNGTLSARETAKVESHLDECDECTIIVRELRDVGHGLRVIVAPLILGGAATAGLLAGSTPAPASAAQTLRPRTPRNGSRSSAAVAGGAVLALLTAATAATILSLSPQASEQVPLTSDVSAPAPSTSVPRPSSTPIPTATPTPAPTPTPGPTSPGVTPPAPPGTVLEPVPTPTPSSPPKEPTPLPELSVAMDDLGALVLGRDGMLGASVTNSGKGHADKATLSFTLPAGVELDPSRSLWSSEDAWTCTQAIAQVDCSAARVAAETLSSVYIPVSVAPDADLVLVPTVTASAMRAASATAAAPSAVLDRGLGTRFVATGRYGSVAVGGSFLSCDASQLGCTEARALQGDPYKWNNQAWNLVAQDEAGVGLVSSSTTLTIPDDAEIAFAGLYWSGPVPAGDTDQQLGALQLRPPAGAFSSISASRVDRATFSTTENYQAFADVTNLVRSTGAGQWTAAAPRIGPGASSGPWAEAGSNIHAGWALVVVYEDQDASPGRVAIFDGLEPVTDSEVSFVVAGLPSSMVTAGVVAWEGDAGTGGDSLHLDGVELLRADSDALPGNTFYARAAGSVFANAFGVDVGGFLPTPLDDARATLSATTSGDQYAIGVITVTTR